MEHTSRLRPLLWAVPLLLLPTAASAHFVWLEPAATGDSVQLCFGEYPTERSGSPLLEKIEGTKVTALNGGERKAIKFTKSANALQCEAVGNAPVVIGHLDYGILKREGSPAYMLRYEAQLLRGAGGALPLTQVARLSQQETGLPLSAKLAPANGGLQLTVTLDGKPVTADVATGAPGASEMEKVKTDAAGKLALPVSKAGWYHLRISAQDAKPVTFQNQNGEFTRTYLSLMFNAAPEAKAANAAVRTDAEAVKILADAHDARANWSKDFPGFTADAVYTLNGKEAKGTITVGPDFQITYALGNKELETALRPSFGSLIMHRRSGGDGKYAATWKDSEVHPLGRAINLNDELGSWYRVSDRQIMQVNRTMGSQRFVNNVMENESVKGGFLPRAWSISYYDTQTNALLRAATTRVSWTWKGEVFMPATIEVMTSYNGGNDVSRLVLSNHRLGAQAK